ncbi:Smr/MutS family protein [Ascidiimonas sp. W6]|uniref:Smr/MutS family protein n=1 Tax=Ascidiimonas meishanensis TaxID=3128903 RepID=UPI0030EE0E51
MSLQKGDRVETIDDALKGIVISVNDLDALVETEEGFKLELPIKELIKIENEDTLKVSNYEVFKVLSEKEAPKKTRASRLKVKDRNAPRMEVDLHIHELTNSTRGMSNYDMLTIQLDTAKRQLEFAMSKRIQKVVFIHGVGQGILKTELEYLFKRYENVSYYDADYQKYGLGATEVYIYQNP